ncbi:conserved hypothetical protein [Oenococcus oeni]|nr:conserved hypothetical protein [Oenococcus oeni]SYW13983.1 conserved hypothetical protein [Oenococcus oeni]SYW15736.1 conserved hypothetical protein [Oenococcus oeni]
MVESLANKLKESTDLGSETFSSTPVAPRESFSEIPSLKKTSSAAIEPENNLFETPSSKIPSSATRSPVIPPFSAPSSEASSFAPASSISESSEAALPKIGKQSFFKSSQAPSSQSNEINADETSKNNTSVQASHIPEILTDDNLTENPDSEPIKIKKQLPDSVAQMFARFASQNASLEANESLYAEQIASKGKQAPATDEKIDEVRLRILNSIENPNSIQQISNSIVDIFATNTK